jgi:hypothetical protein
MFPAQDSRRASLFEQVHYPTAAALQLAAPQTTSSNKKKRPTKKPPGPVPVIRNGTEKDSIREGVIMGRKPGLY